VAYLSASTFFVSLRIIFVASVIAFSSQFSFAAITTGPNGKVGIKNGAGTWILSSDYDAVTSSGPGYVITRNGKQGLVRFDSNEKGRWILSPDYRLAETISATTFLASGITSTDTTITVDDSAGFPQAGTIRIGDEIISYTGRTPTTFTGCTRGDSGILSNPSTSIFTVTSSHTAGTPVYSTTYSDAITFSSSVDPRYHYFNVTQNDKQGMIEFDTFSNWKGTWILSPLYDLITGSYPIYNATINGLQGLIGFDSNGIGEWIVSPKFAFIGSPDSGGLIRVQGENLLWSLLDSSTDPPTPVLVDYDYIDDRGTDECYVITQNGEMGLYSEKFNRWLLYLDYKEISEVSANPSDGKRIVTDKDDKKGLFDGAKESDQWYFHLEKERIGEFESDGKRVVTENAKDGLYITTTPAPTQYLDTEYDTLDLFEQGDSKRIVTNNGKQGLVDTTGEFPKWVWSEKTKYDGIGQYEADGKRIVNDNGKDGLVDATGEFPEWAVDLRYDPYDDIGQREGDGKRVVTNDGKQGLINAANIPIDWVLGIVYEEVGPYERAPQGDDHRRIKFDTPFDKYTLINQQGLYGLGDIGLEIDFTRIDNAIGNERIAELGSKLGRIINGLWVPDP